MIEHLSIEFREMLNLKTEFRWYECWEYKESQRLSPRDFTFGTHSLPSGTHSGTVNPGVCSAVPSAASEPVKPSIYTEIINMGQSKRWRNNLDPFFFSVWFIDFLSFWLATGLPFQHLYCVLNKRGQFSSLKLLKAQTSIHLVTLIRVPLKFTYIIKSSGKQWTEKVIKLNGIS